jgi:D-glycero-alpha-D-manno-heptose-7-phosphate kinase
MRTALSANDWPEVSAIMQAAYPNRKRLAANITTPHMERLVEKAMQHGAEAAKVCGAGGGGCIAFLCAPGMREQVARALSEEPEVQVLDWRFAPEGLTITES